jgi:1-acyl-sn-glycerol-3-phosphate acyltransferase
MVREVVRELHASRREVQDVTLDSALERDLGLDSLGRVEVLQRLERRFSVHLPEQLLATAETPRDLVRAVQSASPHRPPVRASPVPPVAADDTAITLPTQAQTLLEVLDWHAQRHPQRLHMHLYGDNGQAENVTYAGLRASAMAVAAGLQARGLQAGQTVALMLPTGRGFFDSFVGTLMAGGIPVPIYPPARPSQLEDHLRRQAGILANARSVLLITVPEAQRLARLLQAQVTELRSVVTVDELAADHGTYASPVVQAQDIAFIQYTSGSTGRPKGVALTHANLLANIRAMNRVTRTAPTDVFVSWLPLYHDMGLIGAWMGSLYCAYRLVLMSPLTFLAHPGRWLWAIHRHRGTISGAPNFAYELCVKRLREADLDGLDLHSWRLAFNGAEAISHETMERFCARFAPYGLRPQALLPCYGLAENALGLTFSTPGRGMRVDRIRRQVFMRTSRAEPAADDAQALSFVSCGTPLPEHEVRIVDATGYEVAERHEGHLQFRGPSATSGYYRNPDATAELFHGDWLDSGDLAYIADGEVYLTGRAKDIIIRAGRNLYPHELEAAIGELPGIRKGCVAVFGSTGAAARTERLVVLAETRETDASIHATLRQRITELAVDLLGMPPDDIVLAPPQTVLKTSSGKLRRAACRELYERGQLGKRRTAVWWQVTRLAAAGILPQLRRTWQALRQMLYAGYVWTVFGLLAPLAWSTAVLLPGRARRQAVTQALARWGLRLGGMPLHVQGREHLPDERPCVLVSNHASYLDALALLAALPGDVGYVAKQELAGSFVSRLPMQRLGVEFVERFEAQRGIEDTARVVKLVRQGRRVLFFPEGTFGREPGLRGFRLGAFVVAAQTGVPVIPMAIRGTRSILRAGQWFPRRGAVRLSIGTPIEPEGNDWAAAVALRDAARAQMLQMCGEPDLEHVTQIDRPQVGS